MKAILGFLVLMSSIAFAQDLSQIGHSAGFMLLDNGKTYTIKSYFDSNGIVMPQPLGYFTLPEEVEYSGSNYYIDKNDVIHTTDSQGYLYKDMHYLDDYSATEAGGVFFFSRKSGSESIAAHIVQTNGVIVTHHAEGFELFRDAYKLGGVYFTDRRGEMYITNPYDGKLYKGKEDIKVKRKKVVHYGHNYVLMKNGDMIVIGFVPRTKVDEEGNTYTTHVANIKKVKGFRNTKKHGGTFFFNSKNELIAITDQGEVVNRGKVVISSIEKDKSNEEPELLGTSYFIYDDGEAYMIDKSGYLWFLKKLPFYERVGITNVPFER